jgi:hypothetical protein
MSSKERIEETNNLINASESSSLILDEIKISDPVSLFTDKREL